MTACASNLIMQIEQLPPNKPNFGKVVLLSGIALLIVFVAALIILRLSGKHLSPNVGTKATSQLRRPAMQCLRMAA